MMPLYHSTNLPLGWQLQAIFWPLRGKAGGSSQLARETVFSSFISHLLYNLVIWPICNSTFTIILVPIPYSQTENKETPSNVGCWYHKSCVLKPQPALFFFFFYETFEYSDFIAFHCFGYPSPLCTESWDADLHTDCRKCWVGGKWNYSKYILCVWYFL